MPINVCLASKTAVRSRCGTCRYSQRNTGLNNLIQMFSRFGGVISFLPYLQVKSTSCGPAIEEVLSRARTH